MADFYSIPLEEMNAFLRSRRFQPVDLTYRNRPVMEWVYERPLPRQPNHVVRVYTGINRYGRSQNQSRGAGKDAIRVQVIYKNGDVETLVTQPKRVHRVTGWADNLDNRLTEIAQSLPQVVFDRRGEPMTLRRKNGKYFWGSRDYPKYKETRPFQAEEFNSEQDAPLVGQTTEAPYEIKVYVPSTTLDQPISDSDFKSRIDETQEKLSELFGGFTTVDASGGYLSQQDGVISEPVIVVSSWATVGDYQSKVGDLERFLKQKKDDWGQEVIGFEFENDFFMYPAFRAEEINLGAEDEIPIIDLNSKKEIEEYGMFNSYQPNPTYGQTQRRKLSDAPENNNLFRITCDDIYAIRTIYGPSKILFGRNMLASNKISFNHSIQSNLSPVWSLMGLPRNNSGVVSAYGPVTKWFALNKMPESMKKPVWKEYPSGRSRMTPNTIIINMKGLVFAYDIVHREVEFYGGVPQSSIISEDIPPEWVNTQDYANPHKGQKIREGAKDYTEMSEPTFGNKWGKEANLRLQQGIKSQMLPVPDEEYIEHWNQFAAEDDIKLFYEGIYDNDGGFGDGNEMKSYSVVSKKDYRNYYEDTKWNPCECDVQGCLSCFLNEYPHQPQITEGRIVSYGSLWFEDRVWDAETFAAEDNYDSTYGKAQAKIRRKLKNKIKKQAIMGTKAGQWSARKSQELKRQYEAACDKKGLNPYKGKKTKSQDNLSKWSQQKWKTASGKKSSTTGEPYFPAKAVAALKDKGLYSKAKQQKKAATKAGKQNARYSDDIRAVVKNYRSEEIEDDFSIGDILISDLIPKEGDRMLYIPYPTKNDWRERYAAEGHIRVYIAKHNENNNFQIQWREITADRLNLLIDDAVAKLYIADYENTDDLYGKLFVTSEPIWKHLNYNAMLGWNYVYMFRENRAIPFGGRTNDIFDYLHSGKNVANSNANYTLNDLEYHDKEWRDRNLGGDLTILDTGFLDGIFADQLPDEKSFLSETYEEATGVEFSEQNPKKIEADAPQDWRESIITIPQSDSFGNALYRKMSDLTYNQVWRVLEIIDDLNRMSHHHALTKFSSNYVEIWIYSHDSGLVMPKDYHWAEDFNDMIATVDWQMWESETEWDDIDWDNPTPSDWGDDISWQDEWYGVSIYEINTPEELKMVFSNPKILDSNLLKITYPGVYGARRIWGPSRVIYGQNMMSSSDVPAQKADQSYLSPVFKNIQEKTQQGRGSMGVQSVYGPMQAKEMQNFVDKHRDKWGKPSSWGGYGDKLQNMIIFDLQDVVFAYERGDLPYLKSKNPWGGEIEIQGGIPEENVIYQTIAPETVQDNPRVDGEVWKRHAEDEYVGWGSLRPETRPEFPTVDAKIASMLRNHSKVNVNGEQGCPGCGQEDLFYRESTGTGTKWYCYGCFYTEKTESQKSKKVLTLEKYGLKVRCPDCNEMIVAYNQASVNSHRKKCGVTK